MQYKLTELNSDVINGLMPNDSIIIDSDFEDNLTSSKYLSENGNKLTINLTQTFYMPLYEQIAKKADDLNCELCRFTNQIKGNVRTHYDTILLNPNHK
jgi:hypothetical protein